MVRGGGGEGGRIGKDGGGGQEEEGLAANWDVWVLVGYVSTHKSGNWGGPEPA